MPIEGFDYKEFAKNISSQVGPALPPEISEPDGQYIINTVFNFCYMAGEALANDPNLNFNAEQASIVTQFIGEWTFHKSIDIIKSEIDPQFRDGMLQKIAGTIYEIAKMALQKNLPQGDMISIVEHHVKKAYLESLEELKSRGILTEEQVNNALNHSNIDDMAKNQAAADMEAANEAAQQDAYQQSSSPAASPSSDTKLLKLATFAIVMKYLPNEKKQALLNKFSPEDASILADYVARDDIENTLDKSVVIKCINEIKKSLPEPKKLDITKVNSRLYKIVKNSDISKISNMIRRERKLVRDFVSTSNGKSVCDIPPRIADIICNHIEEKLSV